METRLLHIDSEKLLIHRGRMRFIETLATYEAECGSMSLDVRQDNIFLKSNGVLDPVIFVELIAQSIACHLGYPKLVSGSEPRFGYLVGVKDIVVTGSAVLGDHLDVLVEKDSDFENFVFVKGSVVRNGTETICSGILKCYESEADIDMDGHPVPDPGIRVAVHPHTIETMNPCEADKGIFSLITCLAVDPETSAITAEIYLDPEFVGFNGHFPGKPVLPGIMMIKMGIDILSVGLGKTFELAEVRQSKFTKIVKPGQMIRLVLSAPLTEADLVSVQIVVFAGDQVCGKISVSARAQG
jgi:3-hydroxymyristoyl/3-hydroxydecanoyl-(acyl carrier protein) dehydratase